MIVDFLNFGVEQFIFPLCQNHVSEWKIELIHSQKGLPSAPVSGKQLHSMTLNKSNICGVVPDVTR